MGTENYQLIFIISALLWRLVTVFVSFKNEGLLREAGAQEYGKSNSILLAVCHICYYIAAITEHHFRVVPETPYIVYAGMGLYILSAFALVLVMRALGPLWTIKVIISPNHTLVKRGVFRFFRHPNYFLNILPELIAFGVALGAFRTILVGIPIYLIPLVIRVRQEERAMRQVFPSYGKL
jgi:isoprenylcysteine carboxyl methyltransferase (ICMT) family protein YpbQ